jgi:uroporphyrinogen III methyltransferase/synthase
VDEVDEAPGDRDKDLTEVHNEVPGGSASPATPGPLVDVRVVVTRPRHQRSALLDRLRAEGADAISVPTIEIVDPLDEGEALAAAVAVIDSYTWVVFTSANAVSRFCELLRDSRDLGRARIAAIGTATVAELERFSLTADLVPERFISESLLEVFPLPDHRDANHRARVLVPSAEVTRDVLPRGLRDLGWEVDTVIAYRTVPATISEAERAAVESADVVTFTSGSTVDQWVAAFGAELLPATVACIGPVTADVARRHGMRISVIASTHTVDGLVDALIAHLAAEQGLSGSTPRSPSKHSRIGRRRGRA